MSGRGSLGLGDGRCCAAAAATEAASSAEAATATGSAARSDGEKCRAFI